MQFNGWHTVIDFVIQDASQEVYKRKSFCVSWAFSKPTITYKSVKNAFNYYSRSSGSSR